MPDRRGQMLALDPFHTHATEAGETIAAEVSRAKTAGAGAATSLAPLRLRGGFPPSHEACGRLWDTPIEPSHRSQGTDGGDHDQCAPRGCHVSISSCTSCHRTLPPPPSRSSQPFQKPSCRQPSHVLSHRCPPCAPSDMCVQYCARTPPPPCFPLPARPLHWVAGEGPPAPNRACTATQALSSTLMGASDHSCCYTLF